jgi:hypothetical protein
MEQRFGSDFSRVRVHSGAAAEQSARDMNANAYTVGHDIVFAGGRYTPDTTEGRRLFAHEIVHIVQQDLPGGSAPSVDHEIEATEIAERFMHSDSILKPALAAVPAPQRQKTGDAPKTVTIENVEVRVASKTEEAEAKKLIESIKQRFGITFDSQKGLHELKNKVVGDPDEPQTLPEVLSNPNAPKKKVKDLLTTSIWTIAQLRDLETGLTFFRPILGPMRSFSTRATTSQELTTVSRLNVGLNDANNATDKGVYGQSFGSLNHVAFYDSAGSATELTDKNKAFLGIVVHEVAHAMLGGNKTLFVSGLSPAYWKDEQNSTNDVKAEKPVTPYGGKNAGEDLAEAVKFYFVERMLLQQKCPQRYAIVDKLVKNWQLPVPSTQP